ncbi:hypothetical protein AGLY_000378 [Aphis glycines]|uniref:Uncharacterized protein n=1 Tax=Aphis glycines TaxID=307491 RepID=A0A6G0U9E1_APHGL|nr:hypothetical protein AGLY_000378 [Aphis glycines]
MPIILSRLSPKSNIYAPIKISLNVSKQGDIKGVRKLYKNITVPISNRVRTCLFSSEEKLKIQWKNKYSIKKKKYLIEYCILYKLISYKQLTMNIKYLISSMIVYRMIQNEPITVNIIHYFCLTLYIILIHFFIIQIYNVFYLLTKEGCDVACFNVALVSPLRSLKELSLELCIFSMRSDRQWFTICGRFFQPVSIWYCQWINRINFAFDILQPIDTALLISFTFFYFIHYSIPTACWFSSSWSSVFLILSYLQDEGEVELLEETGSELSLSVVKKSESVIGSVGPSRLTIAPRLVGRLVSQSP